jgi:hypothetical protein
MQWKQLQKEEMASVRYNGVEQMAGRASEQMAREESKCEEREKEAWTQRMKPRCIQLAAGPDLTSHWATSPGVLLPGRQSRRPDNVHYSSFGCA